MIKVMDSEKPGHFATGISQCDAEYIEQLLCAILDDAFNLLPSYRSADCARDKTTIHRRIKNEGIGFATVALPRLFNELLSKLEGAEPSFEGFRKSPSSRLPVFVGELLDMVVSQGPEDKIALECLYALCVAFKKLKGDYPKDILSKCIDKFIATDESLLSVDYTDSKTSEIVRRAKRYIDTIFRTIDINNIVPKPGPGAVNTPLKPYMRYEPHVRYAQLDSAFPYRNWFYTNAFGFRESVRKYFSLENKIYPKSRLKFVHKYVGKPRGICIEENETQYLQQGLKNLLYKQIESHPMTKGRVNFKSQQVNRDLALKSSLDMFFSTIDMSEASDRVARDLVYILFRDTPLLDYLDAVSTRFITFPDDVRTGELLAQKFAPMGSAVCFPIMAIVHFALCKAIIATSGLENARKASKQVYVYGDDILTPSEFTEEIFTHLPRFGMKLNKEKSYYQSSFRESCGIHAYKGVDITPVYNNYTLNDKHERKDSTRLLSSLAKEYAYHKKGMHISAAVIRRHIHFVYGQLPFGKPTSRLLCYKRDADHCVLQKNFYAIRSRYDTELQRRVFLMRVVVPHNEGHLSLLGSPALLRWFNVRPEEAESASFMDFDELRIAHRWVSESDLG
jgi:hypothetical protein